MQIILNTCRPPILLMAWLVLLLPALSTQAGEAAPVVPERPITGDRVVALEFLGTEILLGLGITPVGIADKRGYREWVGIGMDRLAATESLGGRQEPNLGALIRLQPDLIVGSAWRHAAIAERLQAIAPTVLYEGMPPASQTDQYTRMRAIVRDLGRLLDREAEAAKLLARLDRTLREYRRRLAAADLDTRRVLLVQTLPATGQFRVFTDNSMVLQVARRLGLKNGWTGPPGAYGFQVVDLAALMALPAAHLLVVTDRDNAAFRQVSDSPAWQAIPSIAAGRLHFLPQDTWFYGGPLSAMKLAEQLTSALTGTRHAVRSRP